jgi:hypothetical protein
VPCSLPHWFARHSIQNLRSQRQSHPPHQSLLKAVNKLRCKWGRKDDTTASWSSRSKVYLGPQVLIASISQWGRQYHPTSRNQEEALHSHCFLDFQTLQEVRMRNSRRVQQCEKAYIGRRSIRGNVFAHVSKFARMDCCCSSSHHRWRRLVSGCTESKRVSLPLLLLRIWSSNDPSSTYSSALHHVGLFAPTFFQKPFKKSRYTKDSNPKRARPPFFFFSTQAWWHQNLCKLQTLKNEPDHSSMHKPGNPNHDQKQTSPIYWPFMLLVSSMWLLTSKSWHSPNLRSWYDATTPCTSEIRACSVNHKNTPTDLIDDERRKSMSPRAQEPLSSTRALLQLKRFPGFQKPCTTNDLKKAQNKSSENLWSEDTQNLWCDEVQDLCADEIRRIEPRRWKGEIAMIGARLSSGASPVVKWKKAVGATPQIQTVWKPTKTGAKRKKGKKHNELGWRDPQAPKCANACELARARARFLYCL